MTERKEQILKAVVSSYIDSCVPISSSEIQAKQLPDLSSATIRNELVALEEMGYLVQPHSSSGRIPTALAYRLYVDKLMPKTNLTNSELAVVKKYFDKKITEVDEILKSTIKVITEITNLTGVACVSRNANAVIDSIKFVKIAEGQALVIIVTDIDIIRDTVMSVDNSLTEQDFYSASVFVTQVFRGRTIREVYDNNDEIWHTVRQEFIEFYDTVYNILTKYTKEYDDTVVLEGSSKILEQPEYASLNKAKAMLGVLEKKDSLLPMLQKNNEMSLNIHIGQDNATTPDLPEYALVTATYSVGGKPVGNAGVIGPMRMDYPKIVSLLDYIGKTITNMRVGIDCGESDKSDSS